MGVGTAAHAGVWDPPGRAAADQHWHSYRNPQVSAVHRVHRTGRGGTVQNQWREGQD